MVVSLVLEMSVAGVLTGLVIDGWNVMDIELHVNF